MGKKYIRNRQANYDKFVALEKKDMKKERTTAYPYIPNSTPAVKEQMLKEVGAKGAEDFFKDIPKKLRLKNACMHLPSQV